MERLSQSPPIFHSFTIFSLHVYYMVKLSKNTIQYVKSARKRSYFGPHFPSFGLNTKRYGYRSVFSPNAGKYGLE